MGAVEQARAADHRVQRRRHRGRVPGRRLRGSDQPRRIGSWPTCPVIGAGSGPSSWPPARAQPTRRSARSCWFPVRRRCWRRKWVPWDQRVRPGDLGPGDLLAPLTDDPRLVPGYMASGDPQVDDVAVEIGLGRRQVMSAGAAARPPNAGTTATTVRARRWRSPPDGCVATAASSFRWPVRWARCSGCAATRCPPTGMSSSSNTAAAHTPTHRRRRAPARRCTTPSTTVCSTSARNLQSLASCSRRRL